MKKFIVVITLFAAFSVNAQVKQIHLVCEMQLWNGVKMTNPSPVNLSANLYAPNSKGLAPSMYRREDGTDLSYGEVSFRDIHYQQGALLDELGNLVIAGTRKNSGVGFGQFKVTPTGWFNWDRLDGVNMQGTCRTPTKLF